MDPASAAILVGGMLGSGAISYFGSQASAAQTYHAAKKMMGLQYKYHNKGLLESPSYQLRGLQKAGLNPLLYMGGGASYAAVSQGSVTVPDWGKGVSEAVMNSARTFADLQNTQSEVNVNDAQAKNINNATEIKNEQEKRDKEIHQLEKERIQSETKLNNANADRATADAAGLTGGKGKGAGSPVVGMMSSGLSKLWPVLQNPFYLRTFLKEHYNNGKMFVDKNGWFGDLTSLFGKGRKGLSDLFTRFFTHTPVKAEYPHSSYDKYLENLAKRRSNSDVKYADQASAADYRLANKIFSLFPSLKNDRKIFK